MQQEQLKRAKSVHPTSSGAAEDNHYLEVLVLLLCYLCHFFQQVLQPLLCSMGNIVDYICAQLTDTELLTCHNRKSADIHLENVSADGDTSYVFP